MRRQSKAAAVPQPTTGPLALGAYTALGALGVVGLVWLGIREFPSLRREIKMWMM